MARNAAAVIVDRRRAERSAVSITARIKSATSKETVRVHDISSTGVQISTSKSYQDGEPLIFIRGNVALAACVAWCFDGKAGLEFLQPPNIDDLQLPLLATRARKPRAATRNAKVAHLSEVNIREP